MTPGATPPGGGAAPARGGLAGRPLSGIRIVDASHVFAIPYATSLLSQLGAEVIKVQNHVRADVMSSAGPFPENQPGDRPWDQVGCLNTVNRGKLGLSVDISQPKGAEVFRRLAAVSDVVAESFTPRVLAKLGLDYAALRQVNERLVMLSNTGYGHTGPWREFGSVATSLEGTSGMCWLSGFEDGPPSKVGQSYSDFITCWNAVFAVMASLYRRNRTGRGQWIDLSMYQAGAATIGPQIMDFLANGHVAGRMGNRHPVHAPHGVYPCRGADRWIAIAVDSDRAWAALRQAMGEPAWAQDPALQSATGRQDFRAVIDRAVSEWTVLQDAPELAARLQADGVLAAPVQDARDLLHDGQLGHRQFFRAVTHPPAAGIGTRPYIGVPWRMSAGEAASDVPAPMLGQHNTQILVGLLGYAPQEVEALRQQGVVSDQMGSSRPLRPLPLERMRRAHRIGEHDPSYAQQGIAGEAGPG